MASFLESIKMLVCSLFNMLLVYHAPSVFIPWELFPISNGGGILLRYIFCLKFPVGLRHYLWVRNSLPLIRTTQFNQHKTSCNKIHLSQIKYKFYGPNIVTVLFTYLYEWPTDRHRWESLHYCSSLPHVASYFLTYKVALQLAFILFEKRKFWWLCYIHQRRHHFLATVFE